LANRRTLRIIANSIIDRLLSLEPLHQFVIVLHEYGVVDIRAGTQWRALLTLPSIRRHQVSDLLSTSSVRDHGSAAHRRPFGAACVFA